MQLGGAPILLPRPEYLVALKLHAAASPTRSKPAVDWEDIRQIIRISHLDPAERAFAHSFCAMVDKMRSPKSKTSPAKGKGLATDLRLPVFDQPQLEHWPMKMSWEEAMGNLAPLREHYRRNFDSPERRLRDKNPKRFSL